MFFEKGKKSEKSMKLGIGKLHTRQGNLESTPTPESMFIVFEYQLEERKRKNRQEERDQISKLENTSNSNNCFLLVGGFSLGE